MVVRPAALEHKGFLNSLPVEFAMNVSTKLTTLLGSMLLGSLSLTAAELDPAQQWPNWRGPLANGSTSTATPPTEFGEQKNLKWKVAIPGSGTATPIVWGDKIFVQTAIPTGKRANGTPVAALTSGPSVMAQATPPPPGGPGQGKRRPGGPGGPGGGMRGEQPVEVFQFAVLCLDRNTGKTLWTKVVREQVPHEGHHQTHGYASGSPVTDGKMLYAYFGSRGLYAMDFSGNIKWEKDFGDQQTRNGFGEGTSPALAGDRLIINWDHEGEDDFIVALDKTSGKELWRKPRAEATTWSTPFIVEHADITQAIVNATGKTRSYDIKNGDLLWECGGQTVNAIPSVVAIDGLAIAMSGFKGSVVNAIKLGSKGDVTGTDSIAWTYNKGTPYVPSPLLYGGKLYFFSGNEALLSIFDAKTGERHVETERISGLTGVYASPLGAGGNVYLAGRDGGMVVIKQGSKVEIVSKTRLDEPIDAQPVAVGQELIIRGSKSLYSFAAK